MSGTHFITSVVHSRAEMLTTDLGLAAFNGQREIVKAALAAGVDWAAEADYLLISALFGQQWEIARDILKSDMPISDGTYKQIFYWGDQSLLNELPPRPDIVEALKASEEELNLNHAAIQGDLETVRRLFRKEWLEKESTLLADRVPRRLLHYAARICQLELLQFLLDAGADVNALTGDGQTALTLISRCSSADNPLRRQCYQLVHKKGGKMIPPAQGWLEKWRLARGGWRSY